MSLAPQPRLGPPLPLAIHACLCLLPLFLSGFLNYKYWFDFLLAKEFIILLVS
jgi:hypothetical protein